MAEKNQHSTFKLLSYSQANWLKILLLVEVEELWSSIDFRREYISHTVIAKQA